MSDNGSANGGDGFIDSAKESLTQEVGPLPVWAWLLAIVIAIAVGLAIRNRFMGSGGGAESNGDGGGFAGTMDDIAAIRRTPIPTPDTSIIDMDPNDDFPQDGPGQEIRTPTPAPEPEPIRLRWAGTINSIIRGLYTAKEAHSAGVAHDGTGKITRSTFASSVCNDQSGRVAAIVREFNRQGFPPPDFGRLIRLSCEVAAGRNISGGRDSIRESLKRWKASNA